MFSLWGHVAHILDFSSHGLYSNYRPYIALGSQSWTTQQQKGVALSRNFIYRHLSLNFIRFLHIIECCFFSMNWYKKKKRPVLSLSLIEQAVCTLSNLNLIKCQTLSISDTHICIYLLKFDIRGLEYLFSEILYNFKPAAAKSFL